MTQGGPGTETAILPVYMYIQAFQFDALGYGSAIALALVLIGALLSIVYIRQLPTGTPKGGVNMSLSESATEEGRAVTTAEVGVESRRARSRTESGRPGESLKRRTRRQRLMLDGALALVGVAFILPLLWLIDAAFNSNATQSMSLPVSPWGISGRRSRRAPEEPSRTACTLQWSRRSSPPSCRC